MDLGLWAFLPQLVLLLAYALALHKHLPMCWLLQTMAFVAFNKVSTAQYFLWYFSLVPLVLGDLSWPPPRPLIWALLFWGASQLTWLAWAYLLEFQGLPGHLMVWASGVTFLVANCCLMYQLLASFRPRRSALEGSSHSSQLQAEGKVN